MPTPKKTTTMFFWVILTRNLPCMRPCDTLPARLQHHWSQRPRMVPPSPYHPCLLFPRCPSQGAVPFVAVPGVLLGNLKVGSLPSTWPGNQASRSRTSSAGSSLTPDGTGLGRGKTVCMFGDVEPLVHRCRTRCIICTSVPLCLPSSLTYTVTFSAPPRPPLHPSPPVPPFGTLRVRQGLVADVDYIAIFPTIWFIFCLLYGTVDLEGRDDKRGRNHQQPWRRAM